MIMVIIYLSHVYYIHTYVHMYLLNMNMPVYVLNSVLMMSVLLLMKYIMKKLLKIH